MADIFKVPCPEAQTTIIITTYIFYLLFVQNSQYPESDSQLNNLFNRFRKTTTSLGDTVRSKLSLNYFCLTLLFNYLRLIRSIFENSQSFRVAFVSLSILADRRSNDGQDVWWDLPKNKGL